MPPTTNGINQYDGHNAPDNDGSSYFGYRFFLTISSVCSYFPPLIDKLQSYWKLSTLCIILGLAMNSKLMTRRLPEWLYLHYHQSKIAHNIKPYSIADSPISINMFYMLSHSLEIRYYPEMKMRDKHAGCFLWFTEMLCMSKFLSWMYTSPNKTCQSFEEAQSLHYSICWSLFLILRRWITHPS